MIGLRMYDPILRGGAFRANVTRQLIGTWRRTIRRNGGFWYGEAEWQGTDAEKIELFGDGLMRHMVESGGSTPTWEGFIAELALTWRGMTYTRSVIGREFANAVKVAYTRVGDSALSNGSGESAAWAQYNGPTNLTVAQDATWTTHGAYSMKIVVADTTVRGATIQSGITVTAGRDYAATLTLRADSGSWRVSCNRADTDQSLCAWSTRGRTGTFNVEMLIPATNTYTGTCDLRITSEAATGTCYADGAEWREAPRAAVTGWSSDSRSVAVYGQVESFEQRESMTDDEATALAARMLAERSWPRLQVPPELSAQQVGGGAETRLSVVALGYIHTLRRVPLAASTGNVSAQIGALLTGNEYISAANINTNTLQFQITDERLPQVEWMQRAIAAGDASGNRWQGGVYRGRRFAYEQASTEVQYSFLGGQFRDVTGAQIDPWWVRPGVVRIDDLPRMPNIIGGDDRLFFADEVEAGPDGIKFRRLYDA